MNFAKFADPVDRCWSHQESEEMPMTAAVRDDWPPASNLRFLNESGVNVNHVVGCSLLPSPDHWSASGAGMQLLCKCSRLQRRNYGLPSESIYEREYTPTVALL